MFNLIRKMLKPKYETLNLITIKSKNIIENFNYLKTIQESVEIFPVLKSNAYGHGLKEMCLILNKTSAKMVIVDSFPEAQIALRYFKNKVLVLSEMPLKTYSYLNLKRTEFAVYNQATLKYLSRFRKKVKIHLFVNTGMNREGIKDFESFVKDNKKYLDRVEVTGLCSHLASAGSESKLNKIQEERFIQNLEFIRTEGYFPKWIHLGNSAALFTINNKLLTAFRIGLSLYGYSPNDNIDEAELLTPALDVFSHIVAKQEVKEGESVSYNENYIAYRNTNIAIVPFGYFEGFPRLISPKVEVSFINKKGVFRAPIAGDVCMNITCFDIHDQKVNIGDRVNIISSNQEEGNSIKNISKTSNYISYELLVNLQANIRRMIIWN